MIRDVGKNNDVGWLGRNLALALELSQRNKQRNRGLLFLEERGDKRV